MYSPENLQLGSSKQHIQGYQVSQVAGLPFKFLIFDKIFINSDVILQLIGVSCSLTGLQLILLHVTLYCIKNYV